MPPTKWTDALLDEKRRVTDPVADRAVTALLDARGQDGLRELIRELQRNADPVPEHMPEPIRAYFEQTAQLPAWADRQKMLRGAEAFCANGFLGVMILFTASLPTAYAGRNGVQVLGLTRRLQTDVRRRIIETAQFVLDVMDPEGFQSGGHAIITTQKVRLIHAAVRHFIRHEDATRADWHEQWGAPINQEDLAGTLMTFSAVIWRGLARYDTPMTAAQADAYLHLWKVVGHILGVDADLLPEDVEDAEQLLDRICERQHAPSAAGKELTKALVDFLHEEIPGDILDPLADANIRYLVGDQVADMLGVKKAYWARYLVQLEKLVWGWNDELQGLSPRVRTAMAKVGYDVLNHIKRRESGVPRTPLRIPRRLVAGPGGGAAPPATPSTPPPPLN